MVLKFYITDIGLLLKNENFFNLAYEKVSIFRRNKTDNLKFFDDKCLSLGSELLLAFVLKKENILLDNLSFNFSNINKPVLIGLNKPIDFNLSHSGTKVVCAVSSKKVGCDIQKIESYNPKLPKRFFNKIEYNNIYKENDFEKQKALFYRYWTLKESFVKCVGLGLNYPLKDFFIDIKENNISVVQNKFSETFYFKEFSVNENYVCAICSSVETSSLKLEYVNFENLL